ncbi:MAG: anhydro-N-acetylmuramic acid kinase [Bacteroidia bacterium]
MKNTHIVLGLMSGTSLDGLDVAFCRFRFDGRWHFEIEKAETFNYTDEWRQRLQALPFSSAHELALADVAYGRLLGEVSQQFLERYNLRPELIASHGHTVFHEPERHLSLQIGDGAAIHALTGLPVVSNFRSLDVHLGGQGAPLVPIGDKLLFAEYEYLLNLGGIANISFERNGERVAFDICPCNLLLNRLAQEVDRPYDEDGRIASSGMVKAELLDKLEEDAYLRQAPPKSLDKTAVEGQFFPLLLESGFAENDRLATVVEHIAIQVGNSLGPGSKGKKMLVTGGGAFNRFLIDRLRTHCEAEVVVPEKSLVEFKEALVFAFLGLLRIQQQENVLSSCTGASRNSLSGALWGKR